MEQMAGTRNYQSIGEVLVSVKTEFPDITISKIRFLEAEGLIEPERTPSGYRKFYVDDVERLKSILRMQRDEYLPLKVIKERLLKQDVDEAAADEELELDEDAAAEAKAAKAEKAEKAATATEEIAEAPTGLQMSIEEMSAATGVERDRIKELESFGIVCSHGPDGAQVLRRRRLHHPVDREGLLPVRDRAPPPHDVQAFRRPRGVVLRGARRADAPSEEPRRAPCGRADARRPVGDLPQVQAGPAPHEPAGPPPGRVSPVRRRRSIAAAALVVALGAQAAFLSFASAERSTPPPTPVPPKGSPSPFVSDLRTPEDHLTAPSIGAAEALLADLDTGQAMFAKAPDLRRPIASLTKVMTALLVLERRKLNDVVTVSPDAVFASDDYGATSTLGLRAGEQLHGPRPPLRAPAAIEQRCRRGARDRRERLRRGVRRG